MAKRPDLRLMHLWKSNDPLLIYDENDCTCTKAWELRTTENQKECLKLFKEIAKRVNTQWQIVMQMKGYDAEGKHRKVVYPLLFSNEKDAWDWLTLSPDPALRPAGVRSWSVQPYRTHKPPIHQPTVRRPDRKLKT